MIMFFLVGGGVNIVKFGKPKKIEGRERLVQVFWLIKPT